MNITSIYFICFFILLYILFFLCPSKWQWCILLVGSIFFYGYSGVSNLLFIFLTSVSVYLATVSIDKSYKKQKEYICANKEALSKEERIAYKKKNQRCRKTVMILTLLFNFGMLAYFKYLHFFVSQVNVILRHGSFGELDNSFSLLVPLGISFYTFQTMGYLVDVYWEETAAEKNYFKVLLFTSFFPQIIQGPISNFNQLSRELFKEHGFSIKNYVWGFERVLWGFFKKLVVANTLSIYVSDVFDNYLNYTGITVFIGALMYSAQIYADFSGYMDIVCGLCEMMDIKLAENFDRPYFSKSISEYWRRWHITLGAWFKTYIYYPVATAKWNQNIAKRFRNRARALPATFALMVVWFATGFWHGASWSYIVWGGVNGAFIIFSLWMEPVYITWKKKLGIDECNTWWKLFQVIRTFFLVTLIKVLPEVGSLEEGVGFVTRIFTQHQIPSGLSMLFPYLTEIREMLMFGVAVIGVVLMFVASMLQRKRPVREYIDRIPVGLRIPLMSMFFMGIVYWGIPVSNGIQFMYAIF